MLFLTITILFYFLQNADSISPATVSMIERLGFPVFIALLLFYFNNKLVNRVLDEHKQQNSHLREALQENTNEIKNLTIQISQVTEKPKRRLSLVEKNSAN